MQIAARTAAWAKSSYTAKDYVQDGLVGQVDGIENQAFGVHDPNALKLTDLIGGIGDLVPYDANFEIGANCITFNNSHGNGGKEITETAFTHEIVVRRRFAVLPGTAFFATFASNGWQDLLAYNNYEVRCKRKSSALRLSRLSEYYDVAVNVSMSQDDNGLVKAYINGELIAEESQELTSVVLKSWSTTYTQKTDMDFMAHRRYDRALTAAEIAANYAVDKARFGLPETT